MKKALTREAITTNDAPRPIGPYAQAVRTGGLVFISGQASVDPKTQAVVDGDIAVQTRQTLDNIAALLKAAGSCLDFVLRCTVYLKNMDDFPAMNEVYGKHFTGVPPARSTVEAARLPKDVLVEIDVIALAPE